MLYTPGIAERRGTLCTYYRDDAFGSTLSRTGNTPTPFGFVGKQGYQTDGSSLMLLGHRYYDPSIGRFISQDPAQDESNWYSYCDNNPLAVTDPTGLSADDTNSTPKPVWESSLENCSTAAGMCLGFFVGTGGSMAAAPETGGMSVAAAPVVVAKTTVEGGIAGYYVAKAIEGAVHAISNAVSSSSSPGPSGSGGSGGNNNETANARAIKSTEKQLAAHENKLAEYRANPMKFDNKGILRNAASPEIRQKIIEGRIGKLQKEIRMYKNQLDMLRSQKP